MFRPKAEVKQMRPLEVSGSSEVQNLLLLYLFSSFSSLLMTPTAAVALFFVLFFDFQLFITFLSSSNTCLFWFPSFIWKVSLLQMLRLMSSEGRGSGSQGLAYSGLYLAWVHVDNEWAVVKSGNLSEGGSFFFFFNQLDGLWCLFSRLPFAVCVTALRCSWLADSSHCSAAGTWAKVPPRSSCSGLELPTASGLLWGEWRSLTLNYNQRFLTRRVLFQDTRRNQNCLMAGLAVVYTSTCPWARHQTTGYTQSSTTSPNKERPGSVWGALRPLCRHAEPEFKWEIQKQLWVF